MLPVPVRSPATSSECSITTDATRAAALRRVRYGRLYDLGRVLGENLPAFPGCYFRQPLVTTAHQTMRSCFRFAGARPVWRARWHRARAWRRVGVEGFTHRPPGSHAMSKKGDRGSGEHRDGNRVDECSLVQAIVRCGDAADHRRNAC